MKHIVHWHCKYHTGVPATCGGVLGVYDDLNRARESITSCIDDDMQRELERATEDGRKPDYGTRAYPGEKIPNEADCVAYSDIHNEEVFYYIDKLEEE